MEVLLSDFSVCFTLLLDYLPEIQTDWRLFAERFKRHAKESESQSAKDHLAVMSRGYWPLAKLIQGKRIDGAVSDLQEDIFRLARSLELEKQIDDCYSKYKPEAQAGLEETEQIVLLKVMAHFELASSTSLPVTRGDLCLATGAKMVDDGNVDQVAYFLTSLLPATL